MTVVKVTFGFRFSFLRPVSGRRASLNVVSLHQLTVVPLPLQPFSLPLVLLPVDAGSVVADGQVCGLITGVESRPWTVGLSLDWGPVAAGQDSSLGSLLGSHLLSSSLGLHLLS